MAKLTAIIDTFLKRTGLTNTQKASLQADLGIDGAPYANGDSAILAPNIATHGRFQSVNANTAAIEIAEIVGGASGKVLKLRVNNTSGVETLVTISDVAILPVEYVGPNPISIPVSKSRTMQFVHNGTTWELQTIGGAYAI